MTTSSKTPALKGAAGKPRETRGRLRHELHRAESSIHRGDEEPIQEPIRWPLTGSIQYADQALLIDVKNAEKLQSMLKAAYGVPLQLHFSTGEVIHFEQPPRLIPLRDAELQRLVDASEDRSSKADAIQARMSLKAVDLVMNGTRWLPASELFADQARKPSNAHSMLARWLEQGRIFALEKNGVRIYPRYAFDAMVEPVPLLKEVLKVLAGRSPFQIASWFESPSNYLDGKRPREVLETNGLAVVTAAQRLVEGAVHG